MTGAAEAVLRRHGRSFHWASRVLPPATAREAALLYAFCREVDDLGDSADTAGEADAALAAIDAALAGAAAAPTDATAAFCQLAERRGVSVAAARSLVATVRFDLTTPCLADGDALIRYAHGVAGTVGVMMCPILGVRAPAARPFAVDLGIAMQLTNIARDVAEDARAGRRYLPATWLGAPVAPATLLAADKATDRQVRAAIARTLATARRYYASAEAGMAYIPPRCRLGILAAARIYAAIGPRVRAAPDWRLRQVVPPMGKVRALLQAVGAFGRTILGPGRTPVRHDPDLHRPIAGFVGADPEA